MKAGVASVRASKGLSHGVIVSGGYSMFSAFEMLKMAWTAAVDIDSDKAEFVFRNERDQEGNERKQYGWAIPSIR